MSRKYPTEPFFHDDGRLVVRGLGPRNYVGLRIPEFRGFHGENTERIVTQYDSVVNGEMKVRAGLRMKPGQNNVHQKEWQQKKDDKESKEETLRLQTHWLTRKWD